MWYVYILKCNDRSFYTGISNDVASRLERHNSGRGAKYTRSRRPVKLLYVEEFSTGTEAKKREAEIKSFSAANKQCLIKFGVGERFLSLLSVK